MTRNTVRRVEIATPIYDRYIQKRLRQMFQIMLMDDEKGKEQGRPINESFPTAFGLYQPGRGYLSSEGFGSAK